MAIENIEIQVAEQTVDLLKQYAYAKTQEDKNTVLQKILSVNPEAHKLLKEQNYAPLYLIEKIEKAIKIDSYRPKNMSILQLATSDDLNHIGGEFDTFDIKLNEMFLNKESARTIRNRFKVLMTNLPVLSQQFAADWIRRLKAHPDLVHIAMNATEETEIDAYSKLFEALAKDFCTEYDCEIDVKIITNWKTADYKPRHSHDTINGIYSPASHYYANLPDSATKKDRQKLIKDMATNPDKYLIPYRLEQAIKEKDTEKQLEYFTKYPFVKFVIKHAFVRLNITNIKKQIKEPAELFYYMIGSFAHEMQHALDYIVARQGALGPQIEIIDRKKRIFPTRRTKNYLDYPTEKSSRTIQYELYRQLARTRF